jgi:outer membrane protein assembly factor BamD
LNFQYFVENYPPSIFTEAAREKIVICRRSLAEHEFLVGKFYFRKRNYQGAVGRFEAILVAYPDTEVVPKALFYMGRAFMNLSLDDKAKTVFLEITHQYPNSEYASKAEVILRTEWNETGTSTGWEQSGESTVPPM